MRLVSWVEAVLDHGWGWVWEFAPSQSGTVIGYRAGEGWGGQGLTAYLLLGYRL